MHYLWSFLMQKNILPLGVFDHSVRTTYPVLPIVAIMALGYALGDWYRLPQEKRKKRFLWLGASMIIAAIALRFIGYGDPSKVDFSSADPILLQVLNVTKYPISLPFALFFVGLALLVLSLTDGRSYSLKNPLVILGQTPMFFYIFHLYFLHSGMILYMLACGVMPDFTAHLGGVPPTFGLTMAQMYGLVAVTILLLLPLCKWYRGIKSSKKYPLLSYL